MSGISLFTVNLVLWSSLAAFAAEKPHVVFLIGETEYKSERTLPPIARELEAKHGIRCTILTSTSDTDLPGLDALATADLAVFYLRFRNLPEAQMLKIRAYLDVGRPVVALRTSTHAFNNWTEFGAGVLGAPWRYHYGHDSSTDVSIVPEAADHPILTGVDREFHARSWLYHVVPLPAGAKPLLMGRSVGPSNRSERVPNPVAWTYVHKGGQRVFYTSLGHPDDFEIPAFRRLLVNGILWALDAPRQIAWREHLIDDQQLSGGLALRGSDGLQLADFDRDGQIDIVSVHEDSNHVRLAFGSKDPDRWQLVTLAEGEEAAAAEDAAIGDVNGDGYSDIVVACELAHLIYFQNPGRNVRTGRWPRVIIPNTRNRGSFIRVFLADLNKDGRLEVVTANKGAQLPTVNPAKGHPVSRKRTLKEISWFEPPSDPLAARSWKEHVLARVEIPINSQPVDLDGDGDLDIVCGSRGEARVFWMENLGGSEPRFRAHRIEIEGHPAGERGLTGFMMDFADLNGDGRLDVALADSTTTLSWIEQPARAGEAWKLHRIGGIGPDAVTGITIADIDGDGRLDAITGGYSQNPRDRDGDNIRVGGRIAWFRNPGDLTKAWTRHDISRTKRGMYDAFIARDLNGDGAVDFIATRGNSGNFDGVFWLEQMRTAEPPATPLTRARAVESAVLPIPE